LIPDTIGQRLFYAAEKYADREAFIFCQTGDRLSFKDLKEKVLLNKRILYYF
jgi:hypothetical protein